MTAVGQIDFEGNTVEDPRQEKVAKALWWADAKRTWGQSGEDIAREEAKTHWPTIRKHYMATAAIALNAADSV